MSEPFIGQLGLWGCNFAPRGWAFCNGQLLAVAQNDALFSLLGTIYGGDGRTTFGLPDLRGRVPIKDGTGPGLSTYRLGQKGGSETNTMTMATMPSHNHTARVAAEAADSSKPGGNVIASSEIYKTQAPDTDLRAGTVTNTGNGQPFNNIQPYLTLNWCISLVGIYPSRS